MPRDALKKRRDRYRSCTVKKRHATEKQARDAALSTPDSEGKVMVAYKCRFCDGWHVGGKSPLQFEE
jgi:hypothetical protein